MSARRGKEPSERVRQVLGLAPDSSPADLEGAYWRLRAHIAARADAAEGPDFIAARKAELEELDRLVGRSVRRAPHPPGSASRGFRPGGARRLWLGVWAAGSTLAALALALLWWRGWTAEETPSPPPELARVSVQAEPGGAELAVLAAQDEQLVARGPADGTGYPLEPGTYRLRVSRQDCPDEWIQEVQVGAGQTREFAPRICRGGGSLVVRSNVSGDRVRIDGLDVGSTGETPHPVSVGDHEVAVEKSGFRPWTGAVRIRPDEVLTLRAELEPEPRAATKPTRAASREPVPQSKASEPELAAARRPKEASPPPEGASESDSLLILGDANRLVRKNTGGSKGWHDAVRDRLLAVYDSDKSGALDAPGEIDAIPCSEWRAIEASYETGGLGISMTRLYGFDGSEAPANTLGVTRDMASYAYNRMRRCGLR